MLLLKIFGVRNFFLLEDNMFAPVFKEDYDVSCHVDIIALDLISI